MEQNQEESDGGDKVDEDDDEELEDDDLLGDDLGGVKEGAPQEPDSVVTRSRRKVMKLESKMAVVGTE
uniref:Uncharacterized protein n=1 Tax=Setaria italica TaxID=4555 RepID=K3ZPD6_SETIT